MSVLDRIIAYKRGEVEKAKADVPHGALLERSQDMAPRGFADRLHRRARDGVAVIAEIKKASPSKGLIRPDFRPGDLARSLTEGGAACLSVLTDGPSFKGDLAYLEEVRGATDLPLLRKDFMIDRYQVAEARAAGADAVLLIMAALDDQLAAELRAEAAVLGLDVLVEVHDEEELDRALPLEPDLLGVNNRNLNTFETDIETTVRLGGKANGTPIVSESGVDGSEAMIRLVGAGYRRFLIGEHLMRAPEPRDALHELLEAVDRGAEQP